MIRNLLVLALIASAGASLRQDSPADAPSSAVLAMLPDGGAKRKFLLDCTGCHQMDAERAFPGGRARSREEWRTIVARMLGYAGASTGFPVIAADRDPDRTADWLADHLTAPPTTASARKANTAAELTEYAYPYPQDLPHDLMVDGDGWVVITGMFTHRMLRLDPASGAYDEVDIPVPNANPRALDIDATGNWWVLLGAPGMIARRSPDGEWSTHEIGMYPHSIHHDGQGRVWFNGHFTRAPVRVGYVDAGTGAVRTFDIPTPPALSAGAGPIPYGLRVAQDGTVWGTELQGNRLFGLDPASGEVETHTLPTAHGGPRRPDFGPDGTLWIPEYAAGMLARFDPRTGRFTEYPLPIDDALPYVVRVDPRSGRVWIGTGAADALIAFDPETERFDVHPLPTRGAMIRHLDVDARTGEVWAAYGASPGIPPKILRLRPRD